MVGGGGGGNENSVYVRGNLRMKYKHLLFSVKFILYIHSQQDKLSDLTIRFAGSFPWANTKPLEFFGAICIWSSHWMKDISRIYTFKFTFLYFLYKKKTLYCGRKETTEDSPRSIQSMK